MEEMKEINGNDLIQGIEDHSLEYVFVQVTVEGHWRISVRGRIRSDLFL